MNRKFGSLKKFLGDHSPRPVKCRLSPPIYDPLMTPLLLFRSLSHVVKLCLRLKLHRVSEMCGERDDVKRHCQISAESTTVDCCVSHGRNISYLFLCDSVIWESTHFESLHVKDIYFNTFLVLN